MKKQTVVTVACIAAAFFAGIANTNAAEKKIKKEKLQIVFLLGQSNMVGLAAVPTARYLTVPQYIPPKEVATQKSRYFDWNFYWSGVRYYQGPKKQDLIDLVQARRDSRGKWRRHIRGTWPEDKQPKGRVEMYAILDQKAEQEGIYKRISDILDSKENQFNVNQAYAEVIDRDRPITEELKRVREIYLKGTKTTDFDAFDASVAAATKAKTFSKGNSKGANPLAEKHRAIYAQLAQKHLNLPIAKRTRIFGHGAIAGSQGQGVESTTYGPLSVGYGGGITTIGVEYGVGVTLERLVDAPILLVKCSWGNTSIADAWRAPSLDGVETPTEKARREAWNKTQATAAKKAGSEFTPRSAPEKKGKLAWAWNQVMPQVDKVLANPGKYYPDYDPKVGYEVAGLVWFQGYSDKDNPAYGELLAQMIKDFRKKVKTPKLPVVCGSLGMAGFKNAAFSEAANKGMLQASQMSDLRGTVDVVNTAPFYPLELDLCGQVRKTTKKESPEYIEATRVTMLYTSNKGFHYHGSAKCFLLAGDAMARSLANLIVGGKPLIHGELK
jgi:hypothetical protein